MKRRSFVLAGGGLVAGAAAGAELMWKSGDRGTPHDAYFSQLNTLLKREGPGHPVMLIDLDRMNRNVDMLAASVGPDKTYRVVAKSLPSVPLLAHVMARAKTTALMSFHQPFLNILAESFPRADILLGKPMPVRAAALFYRQYRADRARIGQQVQWLIDTHERLQQYASLARELGVKMQVSVEIDVGLHRGGLPNPQALDPVLATLATEPSLELSGFMGYEPHLTSVKGGLEHSAVQEVLDRYRGFVERARFKAPGIDIEALTLNGAGSHTLKIYERDRTMNDLSAGSGVVKPTDFDTFHLEDAEPAVFIATPVLKRYEHIELPGAPPGTATDGRHLYYIYGGYWMAKFVSPSDVDAVPYHSTNQEPLVTATELEVDDYVFLRPTQSEHVMLQFGDLRVVQSGAIVDTWPVFHQTA